MLSDALQLGWNKNCSEPVMESIDSHPRLIPFLANRSLEKEKKTFSQSSKVQGRAELEALLLGSHLWFPKSNKALISDFEAQILVLTAFVFC